MSIAPTTLAEVRLCAALVREDTASARRQMRRERREILAEVRRQELLLAAEIEHERRNIDWFKG